MKQNQITVINNEHSTIHYLSISQFKQDFATEIRAVSERTGVDENNLKEISKYWNGYFAKDGNRAEWEIII